MKIEKLITCLLLGLLLSCNVSKDVDYKINKLLTKEFNQSNNPKAKFIKHCRKKSLKIIFNKNRNYGKYIIIEDFNTLFKPYQYRLAFKFERDSEFSYYYKLNGKSKIFKKKLSKNIDLNTEKITNYIYDLAINERFGEFYVKDERRKLSHAGFVYLHIIEFLPRNKTVVLKTIIFDEFGLLETQ